MPGEVSEPPLGTPPPEGEGPQPHPIAPAPNSSASGDDLSLSLTKSEPDPFLEEFKADGPSRTEPGPEPRVPEPGPPGPSAIEPKKPRTDEVISALHLDSSDVPKPIAPTVPSFGSFDTQSALTVPPTVADDSTPGKPVSAPSNAFPPIDFSGHSTTRAEPAKRVEEADEDEDDDLPPRRVSWLTVLMASYASALTLFVIWHFREHRTPPRESVAAEVSAPPDTDTRPDPGQRADQSTRIALPPPIAADHLTTLGKPIQVGSIEVTPLDVSSGPVTLRRVIAPHERRKNEAVTLKLRLRLRNVSNDAAFFPLDEAFLRERERGGFDSFIEPEQGPTIEMYPLAVTSEWSIVGQEYRKLKPGESYETLVVSAPDARERTTPAMTWRLRLRTGIEQTDLIGVQFHDSDIKPSR